MMFGLLKKQKLKTAARLLTAYTDNVLDEAMQSGESNDALLARLGVSRLQALEAVAADDEVESCLEDIRAALLAKPWRIYGDGLADEDKDRLWRIVRRHLPALAETVLTAKLGGFGVARYVYLAEEDGFYTVRNVAVKSGELDKFKPRLDGSLLYNGDNGEVVADTHVQYLLLTSRPTSLNPAGEMAAARLYAACALRKHGFRYAAQFITRYAQPYLVAKIETNGDERRHDGFADKLFGLINGGAISVDLGADIQMLQNAADGQAFRLLENMANARIQKLLLGKVKTADLESGSRAAQETEEKTRVERIDGYLSLLSLAAQHLLDAVVMVNNAYGRGINAPKGVWFEFEQEVKIDVARAERDQKYLASGGLELTADYYTDILGFDKAHFKLAAKSEAKLAVRLSDAPAQGGMVAAEQAVMQPKMAAVLAAAAECADYGEFQAKLADLDLSGGDRLLIQKLVADGLDQWSLGAGDGV